MNGGRLEINYQKSKRPVLLLAICNLIFGLPAAALADTVVMKDGSVYKGKILIDTDKAILIGNPPFDPTSYLLESQDIAKIIYEEYHPNAPAERKRGLLLEARLGGNAFSSSELSLSPASDLYLGAGFRVHPFFELEGGVDWLPALSASSGGLSVSDGTTTRVYQHFWAYTGEIGGRFYPFYKKSWKTEPYATVGYGWGRLVPSASGDHLGGAGWHFGFGAIRPISRHFFLEARFLYEALNYDTIQFLGQQGQINPEIGERRFTLNLGLSWRL
ncbi:MAG TPA: outer membrane beta-barrel protein [Elusimicrobiota bacterium]|nr:outer membrane beta-barrel protein [Elusimicrobiota bacterium]